jgi:hypothetical protein
LGPVGTGTTGDHDVAAVNLHDVDVGQPIANRAPKGVGLEFTDALVGSRVDHSVAYMDDLTGGKVEDSQFGSGFPCLEPGAVTCNSASHSLRLARALRH